MKLARSGAAAVAACEAAVTFTTNSAEPLVLSQVGVRWLGQMLFVHFFFRLQIPSGSFCKKY